MRLLDLFCGRWGWSRAFAARGWECVGVDLKELAETPNGCEFWRGDVLDLTSIGRSIGPMAQILGLLWSKPFDFITCSSPCEEFSVWAMPHFHPNPKYPELGIKLFNGARALCERSGVPYVMENSCGAQMFVGPAVERCGSFYLWGSGVPLLMPQGIVKGASQMRRDGRFRRRVGVDELMYKCKTERAAKLATIPPELANCVAEYAERICEASTTEAREAQR